MPDKLEVAFETTTNAGNKVEFAIDGRSRLYINGEQVSTKLKLDWLILIPAWLTAFASVTLAVVGLGGVVGWWP